VTVTDTGDLLTFANGFAKVEVLGAEVGQLLVLHASWPWRSS
jgi:hypothetical protein